MLVKKDVLSGSTPVTLVDRDGKPVEMTAAAKALNGRTYIFVSDTHQLGASNLAKDALFYIQQIVDRFQLNSESTEFFRHIYQENMGSLFGRFIVNWNSGSDPSYRFQMLTNIDDMVGVNNILSSGEDFELTESKGQRAAV